VPVTDSTSLSKAAQEKIALTGLRLSVNILAPVLSDAERERLVTELHKATLTRDMKKVRQAHALLVAEFPGAKRLLGLWLQRVEQVAEVKG